MSDPYKLTGPTCLSFSGGRTSAYMLWMVLQSNTAEDIGRWLVVCFANTGKEEEATLRFVRECAVRWSVPIVWLEYAAGPTFKIVDFNSASRAGKPFETVIAQRGGILPNRVSRFCSSELKTRTIHRYLRSLGWTEWDSLVGIRADEPRRDGQADHPRAHRQNARTARTAPSRPPSQHGQTRNCCQDLLCRPQCRAKEDF